MFYSGDLDFLREVLLKLRVSVYTALLNDPIENIVDKTFSSFYGHRGDMKASIGEYLGALETKTVYKMKDSFGFSYIYLLLPDTEPDTVLFIGPYCSDTLSENKVIELEEKNGIQPKFHKMFADFCSSVPIISDQSHMLLVIDVFAERIWKTSGFSTVDIEREKQLPVSPIDQSSDEDKLDNFRINMDVMERRYRYENELMRAVSLGQINKVNLLLESFSEESFEKRVSDPIRNLKNFSIIMNTLLRKAAESGGVHPVYLDRVSSSFAQKIEQIAYLSEGKGIAREMFQTYCRLVRKHSMKDFSPIVQKAIIFIESDLSANLTLSTIAEAQNVSGGYLSAIFKKETGKTITQWITEKRINHAIHLLSTTHLQIQNVALRCGIMDVQYFSKIFKRQVGKTPKEYRDSEKLY